ASRRAVLVRGADRRLRARRPRARPPGTDRARRRRRRRPRRDSRIARPARGRRGLPFAQPRRPSPARALLARVRGPLPLVPRASLGLSPDAQRIVGVQALRAFVYGLGSVLIGVSLGRRGLSGAEVGGVLGALLAGTALVSVLLARYGDRIGRRRFYSLLLVAMGGAGTVFALTGSVPALVLAALTGTISTDVSESGPFTSLEQVMLPHAGDRRSPTRLFGVY